MRKLVSEAITTSADTDDLDALATQTRLYRSAARIGMPQTAAYSDKGDEENTTRWPA
ncbi:hypothetical protein [Actinocrispum wychmicini]|uniref:Uncharacterized protein n=1 Tax=Actinocrispum wychmicini TaxID=1213861 RepID=A0A4R2JXD3_9PSEU|nr:hypothetical protein [Actinocrispum wychmicini]TCO62058.1 hypothetical protein EV192_102195 [Actinocrispum wychmicini]